MPQLPEGTYPVYFTQYIEKVDANTVKEALEKYSDDLISFFNNIPDEKHLYKYAEEKWTVKEVLQHIIDTERIFGYRALRISRKDQTPLPGFSEKDYIAAAPETNNRTWSSLVEEFSAVRTSTNLLLLSFNEQQFSYTGVSNGNPVSVNALGYIVFGHIIHHINIIKERYL